LGIDSKQAATHRVCGTLRSIHNFMRIAKVVRASIVGKQMSSHHPHGDGPRKKAWLGFHPVARAARRWERTY
jgi:hypothetical protein